MVNWYENVMEHYVFTYHILIKMLNTLHKLPYCSCCRLRRLRVPSLQTRG